MKMSKRCEYALRALIGLAVYERKTSAPLALTQLAENENIPAAFLEQILRKLKEGGYIASTRGKEGGYALATAPEKVSVGEVVRFIEGPLAPIRCVSRTAYERCSCPNEEACGLRFLMERVRNSVADILDGTTLAALVDSTILAGRPSSTGCVEKCSSSTPLKANSLVKMLSVSNVERT